MKFKNFSMVPRVVFGRGSFEEIKEIISLQRKKNVPMVFFLDCFFKNSELENKIPLEKNDKLIYINTKDEPKTSYVDDLRDKFQFEFGEISGIIGIGGGTVMDITKAVSLMMNNDGSSEKYQGWDLVKKAGVYHACVPTLSGTGSEVSRTAVLTGPNKKLGLNSNFTTFDQVILDPVLIKDVPKHQRFYTGMDCYIHCVESLEGTYLNAFSKSYGEKAFELCQRVFLNKNEWNDESDDDLMMASWHGGMSVVYSQVGIAHAISYGLSYLLNIKHGEGNCIVFDKLEEFYPSGVKKFKKMVEKNEIKIRKGICSDLSEEDFNIMIKVTMGMVPLWENALGKNWNQIITSKKLREPSSRLLSVTESTTGR